MTPNLFNRSFTNWSKQKSNELATKLAKLGLDSTGSKPRRQARLNLWELEIESLPAEDRLTELYSKNKPELERLASSLNVPQGEGTVFSLIKNIFLYEHSLVKNNAGKSQKAEKTKSTPNTVNHSSKASKHNQSSRTRKPRERVSAETTRTRARMSGQARDATTSTSSWQDFEEAVAKDWGESQSLLSNVLDRLKARRRELKADIVAIEEMMAHQDAVVQSVLKRGREVQAGNRSAEDTDSEDSDSSDLQDEIDAFSNCTL